MSPKLTKFLSLFISFCLIFEQPVFAQVAGSLDLSAHFANFGRYITQTDKFRPLHLRYISYDSQNNGFKLLLDKGDTNYSELLNSLNSPNSSTPKLEQATKELFNYFLIGLSLPNDKFWVNLRPDSPDNILDPDLERTDIGRIFLEADLQLKKDTASFTSPKTPEGKVYWDKLYQKAGELFGMVGNGRDRSLQIPTITRPWIVPNEIIIRESRDDGSTSLTTSAYIYKATLKVMLEEDYLKSSQLSAFSSQQYLFNDPRLKELNQYSTQLIKETIIPKLTYEVNTSKRYAPLRQVYYSLILAQWFKARFGKSVSQLVSPPVNPLTGKPTNPSPVDLIDTNNLTNLISKESYDKQTYFRQYQRSFQDGEYNLSEPVYTPFGQSIRRYVSGGTLIALNVPERGTANSSIVSIPTTGTKNISSSPLSFILPWSFSRKSRESILLGEGEIIEINYNKPIEIIIFPGTNSEMTLKISNYEDLPAGGFKKLNKDYYAIIQEGVTRRDVKLLTRSDVRKPIDLEKFRPKGIKALRNGDVVILGRGFNPKIEPGTREKIFNFPTQIPDELIRIERRDNRIIITNLGPEEGIKIITDKISEFKELKREEYLSPAFALLEAIYKGLSENNEYGLTRVGEDAGEIYNRFYGDSIIELEKSPKGYKITVNQKVREIELDKRIRGKTILDEIEKVFRSKNITYQIKSGTLERETLFSAISDMAVKENKHIKYSEGSIRISNDTQEKEIIATVLYTALDDKYHVDAKEEGLVIIRKALQLIKDIGKDVDYSIEKIDNDYNVVISRLLKGHTGSYEIYVEKDAFENDDNVHRSASPLDDKTQMARGGIDFTRLPIVTQAITNLGSSPLRPSSYPSLRQLNLDEEYQAIKGLASSGISPYPERLKSFLQASCLQERIGEEKDNILGLIASVLREEESSLRPTGAGLLDILVAIEASTTPQQLKEIFLGKIN